MSLPSEEMIKCPKCGKDVEFTLWNSINTEMDFAIPDIISGKLFEAECKNCGFVSRVLYPILFNDMIHKVFIWLILDTDNDNIEIPESLSMAKLMDYRIRVVTSQEALREKTAIFNAGLDDRVVEIAKLMCEVQLADQLDGAVIEKMYLNINDDGLRWELIIDGKQAFVNASKETILQLGRTISEDLPEYKTEPYIIDRDWAINFLDR